MVRFVEAAGHTRPDTRVSNVPGRALSALRAGASLSVRPMLALLLSLVGAAACDSANPTTPPEGEVAAVRVAHEPLSGVSPTAASVQVGSTVQLVAVDASGNEVEVRWRSSDEDVATVSSAGLVRGVAAGAATVTARSRSESASASVTVTRAGETGGGETGGGETGGGETGGGETGGEPAVASVAITPDAPALDVGETVQLAAAAKDASGNPVPGASVVWSSSDAAVAKVSSAGVVTALAEGSAVVRAVVDGSASDNTTVTVAAPVDTTSPPPTTSAPTGPSQGIWLGAAEIAALPTSGTAWNNLKSAADQSCGTPDLADQDQGTNVCVMAKALVFARTGDTRYRADVVAAIRSIVGSGTYNGRALSLGRELSAYVVAADLVDLAGHDASLDGAFRAKLRELLTTPTTSGPTSLVDCHERRANNWGTHCGASRAAVAAYLGDRAELDRVARVFRGWVGDRTAYAGFKFGSDVSWACDTSAPVGINPAGCTRNGHSIDGVLPDDQRRNGSFTWPPPKANYVWGGLSGAVAQAMFLHRQGYPAFEWSDRAIFRAVRWLHTQASFPAEGDDAWVVHVVNDVYGTSFPQVSVPSPGKNLGWTDWTH